MKLTPKISFKNVPESEGLVNVILERIQRLDHFFDRITGCQVLIEAPHHHHHKGNHYRVRINLTVPGKEIVATRSPDKNKTLEDPYIAVREAFDAIDRRLQDYARERRGAIKLHSTTKTRTAKSTAKREGLETAQEDWHIEQNWKNVAM